MTTIGPGGRAMERLELAQEAYTQYRESWGDGRPHALVAEAILATDLDQRITPNERAALAWALQEALKYGMPTWAIQDLAVLLGCMMTREEWADQC